MTDAAPSANTQAPPVKNIPQSFESRVRNIGLAGIACLINRRALRPKAVDALANSMNEVGLINPITIRPSETGGFYLIAGRHRYEAARKLKWEVISAIVLEGLTADEAELREIDENLIRAELTPAEQAAHHTKRKELHEKLHPETKHGGDRKSAKRKSKPQNADLKSYAEEAAAKTSRSGTRSSVPSGAAQIFPM